MVRKALKILLGLGAAVVAAALLLFFFFLGPTVKLIAETIGSKALGSPLTVEKLAINPRAGTIHLTDFKIANHQVFGQSNAVSLASLDIAVDMSSLLSSTILVHQVNINSPHFVYEQSELSDNISEFILSIQAFAGIDPSAPPPPRDPKKEEKKRLKKEEKARKRAEKPPKIVIVEALAINDTLLSFVSTKDEKLNFGAGFERFAVSMTNGAVRLDDLFVSNPGRLKTENLFHLDQATLNMVPDSIYSSNITINAVNVRNPSLNIEYNAETDTLGEFLKIASGLATKIPTNAPGSATTHEVEIAEAPAAPPPNLALESFQLDDLRLNLLNQTDPGLNMTVGLERVDIALEHGEIALENLYIGNPARLTEPHLFLLERVGVQLKPGSHLEDTVIVEEALITRPYLTLELRKDADTVSELLKIAKGYTDRLPTYPVPEFPPAPPETESPPSVENAVDAAPPAELYKLAIDDIQIRLLDATATNQPAAETRTLLGVERIALDLAAGDLDIREITMPNLAEFRAPNLFHLANIDVKIHSNSINEPQFVIDQIFIDSPEMNLEQTETSGNVLELQSTLMKFVPDPAELPVLPATEQTEVAEASEPSGTNEVVAIADQPVILNELQITNFAVNLKFPVDTNVTEEARFGFTADKLNPMSALSGLKGDSSDEEEPEIDPNEAITLFAFEQLLAKPLEGELNIDRLRVSNPPSFTRRDLVRLERFHIKLDPDSLRTDQILIHDVELSKPRVRYERQITTDNLKALREEIELAATRREAYEGDAESPLEQETNEDIPTSTNETTVVIERVALSNIVVRAKLSALPAIPTPPFNLEKTDIGKEEGGATLAQTSTMLFEFVYEGVLGAVGGVTGVAGDTLKKTGALTFDAMGNIFSGVTEGVEGLATGVKEGAEDVLEDVKSPRRKGAGGRRRFFQ